MTKGRLEKDMKKITDSAKSRVKKGKKDVVSVAKDFKGFAFKGNIVDLSVGLIIGTAFTKIVNSLVSEIITPILNTLTSNVNFNNLFISLDGTSYDTLEAAKAAGAVTINYGSFITNVIDFFIIAFVLFIILRFITKRMKKDVIETNQVMQETTKKCSYCKSTIDIEATRCPYCTSEINVKNKEV